MKEQKPIKYPKTYRETIGRMLGCFWFSIMGTGYLVSFWYLIVLLIQVASSIPEIMLICFVFIGLLVSLIWFQRSHLGERFASKITFFENRVVWRCFGFLPVVMKYDEMEYVGIESFDDYDRRTYDSGDEWTAYIYMSVKPYPKEYRGKIIKLRTKKSFIKFKYTDGVAEALMDRLPVQKVEQVRGFYYKMKYIKLQEEQERAKEKIKRKKKREKRKRQREKNKTKRDL